MPSPQARSTTESPVRSGSSPKVVCSSTWRRKGSSFDSWYSGPIRSYSSATWWKSVTAVRPYTVDDGQLAHTGQMTPQWDKPSRSQFDRRMGVRVEASSVGSAEVLEHREMTNVSCQ